MHIRNVLIGSCALTILLAAITGAVAIDSGAADGAGVQLGTLLGVDLVVGAGMLAALLAAGNRTS